MQEDKLSQSVQDYLKTIYMQQETGVVSTTEIAKQLNVSGASVTGMLKRLANMSLVEYNSYKGVRLTEKGDKIALEIIRHHRLLELFLQQQLGFTLDKVHDEACRLEHYISQEFADRIDKILGSPKFDPHGHPIPDREGHLPQIDCIPLTQSDAGDQVIIRRLHDADREVLGYLEKIGLVPGVEIKILEKAPFNGPLTIQHKGESQIVGNELAKNIFIETV